MQWFQGAMAVATYGQDLGLSGRAALGGISAVAGGGDAESFLKGLVAGELVPSSFGYSGSNALVGTLANMGSNALTGYIIIGGKDGARSALERWAINNLVEYQGSIKGSASLIIDFLRCKVAAWPAYPE